MVRVKSTLTPHLKRVLDFDGAADCDAGAAVSHAASRSTSTSVLRISVLAASQQMATHLP